MKKRPVHHILIALILITGTSSYPQISVARHAAGDPPRAHLIETTEAALVDQIKCQTSPKVALAINAMIKNRLIQYRDNESGVYLFAPNAPLTFLGLRIKNISGFDYEGFRDVPSSTMTGTAPPVFLEIDVAATESELRERALRAGLVEGSPSENRRGFEVSARGSYLAGEPQTVTSKIECFA